jgi:hypothetical protein
LFIVQGPFSVAPCQTLISRFATFSSPYGGASGAAASGTTTRRQRAWPSSCPETHTRASAAQGQAGEGVATRLLSKGCGRGGRRSCGGKGESESRRCGPPGPAPPPPHETPRVGTCSAKRGREGERERKREGERDVAHLAQLRRRFTRHHGWVHAAQSEGERERERERERVREMWPTWPSFAAASRDTTGGYMERKARERERKREGE